MSDYNQDNFTMQESKLLDFLKDILEKTEYKSGKINIEAISSGGANYTSRLYVATVSAPSKEDLKLFAKVANVGEAVRATNDLMTNIFQTERIFYTEIFPTFEELYKKHRVPEKDRLYISRFYGCTSTIMEETIVLENLAAKGFGNFDRSKTFNWDYASSSIKELSKFHALGLAYKVEKKILFEKISKDFCNDMISYDEIKDVYIKLAVTSGTSMIKDEYQSKVQKYIEKDNLLNELAKLWTSYGGACLIHGDYRPSNLMHRRKNGKLEIVPLDYQTCRLGMLAMDLMYFIWSGSDSQFRKHYYKQLIEFYYTELTHALNNLHINIDVVYPRKQFEQELETMKTLGLIVALTLMPLFTVDPENAPKTDSLDNMLFSPNQLARDRVHEIVDDCIQWGLI